MKQIKTLIYIFVIWTAVGMISKLPFLLLYHDLLADATFVEQCMVIIYGLRLDVAVAGYLCLLPGIMLIVSLWNKGKLLKGIWHGYFIITSLLCILAYGANLALYNYWGFPLDSTPILYIRTSPGDAVASMETWQLVASPLLLIVLTVLLCWIFGKVSMACFVKPKFRMFAHEKLFFSFVLLLLTAVLIIPIRGGFATGTNHTGSVYFSSNNRLNHAAVNPVFSFVESAAHKEEIGTKYRFFEDKKATKIFDSMTYTQLRDNGGVKSTPNVILISLESFSRYIMDEAGHVKNVTPNLDRLAQEGVYFTHFYANSFRTDRALVSIHSALPAQPTMSIMDMPHKSASLPSIANTLQKHGYATTFYYGGDINYSNMRSYFVGTGFQTVVSDGDFSHKLQTGKWGVADGPVFERLLSDIKADNQKKPFFRSFMTGSSHEPFDVPNYNKLKDSPSLNAFSYTDMCLGKFMDDLKTLPSWKNTIVIIVPDHLGAYPENIDNYELWRYELPLIITGGAVPQELLGKHDVVGSQIDIAATLFGMLGFDHSDFLYSKDLFDARAPHFAFFTVPDAMGMITTDGSVIYDNITDKVAKTSGNGNGLLDKAKAYLQKLYDDIDRR